MDWSDNPLDLNALGDEIDTSKQLQAPFVRGRAVDGMDFKADECRMVVLTTLPRAINARRVHICLSA